MSKHNLFWCALLALFVCVIGPVYGGQTWIPVAGSSTPEMPSAVVLGSNENETIISFTINGFLTEDIEEGGTTYQALRMPGYFTTQEIGKPQLPVITELVAVPGDAIVDVSVTGFTEEVLTGYNVFPFQTPLLEEEEPAQFDIDEAFYSLDTFYPDKSAEVGDPSIWRDLRVVALTVNPFKFNPKTGQLKIYEEITVKLTYSDGSQQNVLPATDRPVSPRYNTIYNGAVLNYGNLEMEVEGQAGQPAQTDYDYLIIAVDGYVDNMASFVNWKEALGLETEIVPLSEVGYSVTEIKNYITQEYNDHNIEYVLFVGNESSIPGYTGYGFFSDYYYTLIAGSDNYPDIALGRLCVHSETDVDIMRDKSILFEKDPPTGDWLEKALLVAHKQNAPGKYQQCKERIRLALETPSLTYSILYPDFTTAYGADISVGGDRASNADVIGHIDDGQRVVNYRGHGSTTSWTTWNVFNESFGITQVNMLDNGEKTPIVFNIACYNHRINSSSQCLGEAWTLSDEGAAASLGATNPSYTTANHTYDKKLFSVIFDEGVNAVGDASNVAAIKIINQHGGTGLTNARMYLWLGDPSLQTIFTTAPAPQVVSTMPARNELDVAVNTDIRVTWDVRMDFSTINNSSLIVNGSMTGLHDVGSWYCSLDGRTVGFNPDDNFAEGEVVTVVLTTAIKSAHGVNMAHSYTWSFTVGPTLSSSGTFRHDDDYDVGTLPLSVYGALYDGDGDIDLAAANRNSENITVLLNNGNATFPPGVDYPADTTPVFACAGDFDGDGDMDLAAANYAVGEVEVLLNYGNGTFAPYLSYPADNGSTGIVAADFNGDGDLDLAVSNWNPNNVSILLGNGNGTFASPTDYGTGSGPNHIFAGDLDNDADIDLVTSNSFSNNVSVLMNDGDGTFAADVVYATGTCPEATYAADLNGDSYLDLMTANKGSNNISVLINDGDGTFASQVNYGVGSYPIAIFGFDLNGDGDIDIVTSNLVSDNISILKNYGSGTFSTHTTYSAGDGPSFTYPCDLDGDGDLDLAVTNQYSQDVSIFINRPLVNPSCPVLFSFDGNGFKQENPLLTACENSGYVDVVTDYYHVQSTLAYQDGMVAFQLREMEDEITYLHNIELITVDHPINTTVACDINGRISTYSKEIVPLSATDNNGKDQLSAVVQRDGNLFTSSRSGHLVVTFPNTGEDSINVIFDAQQKKICYIIQEQIDPGGKVVPEAIESGDDMVIEILGDDGIWIEVANEVPTRENTTQEVVLTDLTAGITGDILTLRLSWKEGYSTDAILQSIPSAETFEAKMWSISSHDLGLAKSSNHPWHGFVDGKPLVLEKDDVFGFTFAPDPLPGPGLTRDYIIRAVGRYQPDFSVFTNLLPEEFRLDQNYPNPFNPSTQLRFSLPEACHVELIIHNIAGQLVRTLIDESFQAGIYNVEWDGRNSIGEQVASGIYFYRIKAGEFTDSKKMILLR